MRHRGQKIEVLYSDAAVVYESRKEFAKHLSLSMPRTLRLLAGREVLTEKEYEEILAESYKPAPCGVKPGTRRKR